MYYLQPDGVPMSWIQTNNIRQFFPLDPRPEDVSIQDIAHSLSHLCRYNGHSNTIYTVATHSIMVCKIVEKLGGTDNEIRWALAHDFAEAYVGDLPSPIKSHPSMSGFRDMEDRIVKVIATKLGLEGPEPGIVKAVDRSMISFEATSPLVFDRTHAEWPFGEAPQNIKDAMEAIGGFDVWARLSPMVAKKHLIMMCHDLGWK